MPGFTKVNRLQKGKFWDISLNSILPVLANRLSLALRQIPFIKFISDLIMISGQLRLNLSQKYFASRQ